MIKRYLAYLFKSTLVITVFALLIMFLIPFIEGLMFLVDDLTYSSSYYAYMISNAWQSAFSMACVLSLFYILNLEDYRYRRQSSDCYYSLPFKPRQLKHLHFSFGIAMTLAIYTLSFWCPTILLSAKVVSAELASINVGLFIADYLISVAYIAAYYALMSFFAHRGNTIRASIIMMLLGNLCLSLVMLSPSVLLLPVQQSSENIAEVVSFFSLQSYSPYMYEQLYPESFAYWSLGLCPSYENGDPMLYLNQIFANGTTSAGFIVHLIVTMGVSGAAGVYHWLSKDPDGSYSGAPGGNGKLPPVIFLVAYAIVNAFPFVLYYAMAGNLTAFFILILVFILEQAALYLLSALYLWSPKLNKWHWICLSVGAAVHLIAFIVGFCLGTSNLIN